MAEIKCVAILISLVICHVIILEPIYGRKLDENIGSEVKTGGLSAEAYEKDGIQPPRTGSSPGGIGHCFTRC
ncbi:hypothetical protein M5689_012615 [Euphorbia peplus]|nr:hypothetical protein M5689_012615 [Euphorbia peplus]